jgi:hypothetical protein
MFSLLGTSGGYITFVACRGGGNTTAVDCSMIVSLSSTRVPLIHHTIPSRKTLVQTIRL